MEKYCRAGQATDDMAHAHCILDTKVYKHTLRMCNSYCFSTATMIARTCFNVGFYVRVHCRSYYNLEVVCSLRGTNLVLSKTLLVVLEGLIELPVAGLQCELHFGPYRFYRKTELNFLIFLKNY